MTEEKFSAALGSDLNFYQFGLSPEDEARQTAQRAWFDGHQSALVMTPDSEWGKRVLEAFRSEWQSLGGEILEQQNYITEIRDFIEPVKYLLNVDGSEQRAQLLGERLGRRIEFLPRRRQDADFIFLAAYPAQGRQIRPHLRFYRAGGIPVYSTSHIFSGKADAEADLDMDGIAFGDMPVVFDNDGRRFAVAAQSKQFWPDREGSLTRLYALGADAYAILGHLGRLRTLSSLRVEGATGILSMDRQGRIKRQLTWASFRGGIPKLVDDQISELR
jgi:outer membrane PBP1 activator LpoA protein